jgi:hypothetical protein
MTEPTDPGVVHAYARQAVEEYLQAVAVERADLERSIAEARERAARATSAAERSAALERRVGSHIVSAHARVRIRRNDASATAERILNASTGQAPALGEEGLSADTAWTVAPPPPAPTTPGADERSPWAPSEEGEADDAPSGHRLVVVPDRRADDFFEQLRVSVQDNAPLGAAIRPAWMATHG